MFHRFTTHPRPPKSTPTTKPRTPRAGLTFDKFLLVTKGLHSVTVRNHVRAIDRIEAAVGGLLTRPKAKEYVANLYAGTASYSHKTNSVTAIEYYLEWRGVPFRFARLKKPHARVVAVLSEPEITRILTACNNLRERAILSLVAYSGIRPGELEHIRTKDLDLSKGTLDVIRGKGGYGGVVYLSPACLSVLHDYLAGATLGPEDRLFTTKRAGLPFGAHALRKLFRRVGKRAGLTRRLYPYLLRHSLATHMIERNAPLLAVKQQLRHRFLETTYTYVQSLTYNPEAQYDRMFPKYV